MDYSLTCWYLNARRITEITGYDPGNHPKKIQQDSGQDAYLSELARLRHAVLEWLKKNKPPSFEKLILTDELAVGQFFTHHGPFYFKGLGKLRGKANESATGYTKLKHLGEYKKLEFKFSPEHLTSNSSWVELSGQTRKFLLAVVTDNGRGVVKCSPYVIANLTDASDQIVSNDSLIIGRYMEQFPSCIDQFSKTRELEIRPRKSHLVALKNIPEAEVKKAFAEIIHEPTVPKDWGGERSDLFTANISVNGQPLSAAFAFKGPSKFHPMTFADLGKNGDQIERLYTEPADLLILQHCHEITPPVRKMMRAFANQAGNLRQYCIIDGYQTFQILTAYNKCGLGEESS